MAYYIQYANINWEAKNFGGKLGNNEGNTSLLGPWTYSIYNSEKMNMNV